VTASRVASGRITRSWSTGCSSEACGLAECVPFPLDLCRQHVEQAAATPEKHRNPMDLHLIPLASSARCAACQVWGPAAQNLAGVVYSGKP